MNFVLIKRKLGKIEKRLFEITRELSKTKEIKNSYYARKRAEINELYERARLIFRNYAIQEIPAEYNEALRKQIKKIKNMSISTTKSVDYQEYKDSNISIISKDKIIKEMVGDFSGGLERGRTKFVRLIRNTQQVNVSEKEISEAIKTGRAYSVNKSKKRLQETLTKDALNKEYITIIDKNGKQRNYKTKSYSEMVARTKTAEAQTEATLNTAKGFGADLVQVSSHNTKTPFDAQFEGKIFSLSGKDKLFPGATFLPPFHPNCIHRISIWFAEAHTPEQVKRASDFSLGKTEIHPTRKSHIPVSKREL